MGGVGYVGLCFPLFSHPLDTRVALKKSAGHGLLCGAWGQESAHMKGHFAMVCPGVVDGWEGWVCCSGGGGDSIGWVYAF